MTAPGGCTVGILGAGSYVPSTSVRTRRGWVPVGNGDEDAVTMAIEAGNACLRPGAAAAIPNTSIDELILVTGGAPTFDEPHAEVVREALGFSEDTRVSLAGGDRLGAVSALLSAIDSVASGRITSVLVIAVELGDTRHIGAGSAAMLIGSSSEPAVRITGVSTQGAVVYDRWQERAPQFTSNEPRYVQYATERALAAVLGDGSRASGPVLLTGAPLGAATGTAGDDVEIRHIADFGVAGALFAIVVGARESGGPFRVVAAAGSRTALLSCVAGADAGRWLSAPSLDRTLAGNDVEAAASPMLSLPSSSPFFERSARELLRLEGARCRSCGHVVFPPTQRPICAECRQTGFDRHLLSRSGSVYTFTVNHFLPVGFGSQMILILAELDDGYRYWAPASGMAARDVEIGVRVRLGVRRFTDHGGVPVYAMKFLSENRSSAQVTAST